jgi:hypothetical protein
MAGERTFLERYVVLEEMWRRAPVGALDRRSAERPALLRWH